MGVAEGVERREGGPRSDHGVRSPVFLALALAFLASLPRVPKYAERSLAFLEECYYTVRVTDLLASHPPAVVVRLVQLTRDDL
jgi:hypothetical protein